MENDAKLLENLIFLNYEYSNDKPININHIFKTLHDTVNYTKDEEEKIKKRTLIYLRVDYGLEFNK